MTANHDNVIRLPARRTLRAVANHAAGLGERLQLTSHGQRDFDAARVQLKEAADRMEEISSGLPSAAGMEQAIQHQACALFHTLCAAGPAAVLRHPALYAALSLAYARAEG